MKELLPTAAHAKATEDECSCASWALQNLLLYVKCELGSSQCTGLLSFPLRYDDITDMS